MASITRFNRKMRAARLVLTRLWKQPQDSLFKTLCVCYLLDENGISETYYKASNSTLDSVATLPSFEVNVLKGYNKKWW